MSGQRSNSVNAFLTDYAVRAPARRGRSEANDPLVYGASGTSTDAIEFKRHQSDVSIASKTSRVHDYGFSLIPVPPLESALGDNTNSVSRAGTLFDSTTSSWPPSLIIEDKLPNESNIDYLVRLLDNATLETNEDGSGRDWIPISDLREICQRSLVLDALKETFPTHQDNIESYADYICGPLNNMLACKASHRIFAILVLARKLHTLPSFIDEGLSDAHLPLLWTDERRVQLKSKSRHSRGKEFACFGTDATPNTLSPRRFIEFQWRMLAPYIGQDKDKEVKEYQLHKNAVMPWTSFGPLREGGFSTVRCVKIHDAHHSFGKGQVFALKTLSERHPDRSEESFEKELRVFRKMKPEVHLVELYATFKIEKGGSPEFRFLFPWAAGGGLDELWHKEPPQMLRDARLCSERFLKWLAEQSYGLAMGLRSIHDLRVQAMKESNLGEDIADEDDELYGIHGDIKPANILHFVDLKDPNDLGTLKIADFGFTEFHRRSSRTYKAQDGVYLNPNLTYLAPERRMQDDWLSRKIDIWSLGCVFCQFVTWAFLGVEGLKDFDRERTDEKFNEATDKRRGHKCDNFIKIKTVPGPTGTVEITLKDSTKQCLKKITTHVFKAQATSGPSFLVHFLKLIGERMLVIEREGRINGKDLVMELEKLVPAGTGCALGIEYWNTQLPSFANGGT